MDESPRNPRPQIGLRERTHFQMTNAQKWRNPRAITGGHEEDYRPKHTTNRPARTLEAVCLVGGAKLPEQLYCPWCEQPRKVAVVAPGEATTGITVRWRTCNGGKCLRVACGSCGSRLKWAPPNEPWLALATASAEAEQSLFERGALSESA